MTFGYRHPRKVVMSGLLDRLRLGTSNIKLVKWPGSDVQVTIRILSQQDIQEAHFATERLFKVGKIETNLMTADEYENEKSTQILFRSLRNPENLEEPICKTIEEFRRSITREEKKQLIEEYLGFESECSPSPDNLSDDEFDKVLSDLKKKPAETLGNITSMSMLKKLLLTMASPLAELPRDNG